MAWVGDGIDFLSFDNGTITTWQVDELWEALVFMLAGGVPSLFISLHLFNAMARMSGWIARVMLSKSR